MQRRYLALITLVACGCATVGPKSLGEQASGYTYIPLDPFAVRMVPGANCSSASPNKTPYLPVLMSLPDNSVRVFIEQFDASGAVKYGVGATAIKGGAYRVTADYINADTINRRLWISRSMMHRTKDFVAGEYGITPTWKEDGRWSVPISWPPGEEFRPGTETYFARLPDPGSVMRDDEVEVNLPIYVGVGLRVSAIIDSVDGSANISGVGSIGFEAEAKSLRGSLVVQTLGVNGKSVAAALPIQSDLNRTTVQNALTSVGAIKALLWATDETAVSPRVVGLYLPIAGGKPLVNAIISALSMEQFEWKRPCGVLGADGKVQPAPALPLIAVEPSKLDTAPKPKAPMPMPLPGTDSTQKSQPVPEAPSSQKSEAAPSSPPAP